MLFMIADHHSQSMGRIDAAEVRLQAAERYPPGRRLMKRQREKDGLEQS